MSFLHFVLPILAMTYRYICLEIIDKTGKPSGRKDRHRELKDEDELRCVESSDLLLSYTAFERRKV
jgi:hypothetical protein